MSTKIDFTLESFVAEAAREGLVVAVFSHVGDSVTEIKSRGGERKVCVSRVELYTDWSTVRTYRFEL